MPLTQSRRRLAIAAALACAATVWAAATVAIALPSNSKISASGLGPIKIGMTVAQVERAGKRDVTFEGGDANAVCATAALGSKLYGLFSKGRLARVYVNSRLYRSRAGIRVGDSQSKVLSRYRGLARQPHAYVRGGFYLKLTIGNRRLVFDTDGKRVTQISGGRKPEIDYIEGCS